MESRMPSCHCVQTVFSPFHEAASSHQRRASAQVTYYGEYLTMVSIVIIYILKYYRSVLARSAQKKYKKIKPKF
jgi:hypothetical protein